MNQKQLYILMVLLMAVVLIINRPTKFQAGSAEPVGNQYYPIELEKGGLPMNSDSQARYSLGIAFSGGGVKAFFHAGVLKALEEHHIKPDILSGVSAGAVIAALYADGYSPDSILSLFEKLNYLEYVRFKLPKGGFFSMQGFKVMLDSLLSAETFEQLSIPVRVVATDLDRGQSVVFDSGNLVDALVASCSVPVLFSPYIIDGVNYVDGGILQNLPSFAIRSYCNVLVGVSTGPLKTGSYDISITDIALRSYRFIYRNNARNAKEMCDVLIESEAINRYNGADLLDYKKIFDLGYQETKRKTNSKDVMNLLK